MPNITVSHLSSIDRPYDQARFLIPSADKTATAKRFQSSNGGRQSKSGGGLDERALAAEKAHEKSTTGLDPQKEGARETNCVRVATPQPARQPRLQEGQ